MEGLVEEGVQKESSVVKQLRDTTRFIKQTGSLTPDSFKKRYGNEISSAFPGTLEEGLVPVIICARNETERNRIGQALYGLAKSDLPVQPVVVDNGSTDGTGDLAKELGAIVITQEQAGLIHALRKGFSYLKEAGYSGPILTTDADSVPLPTWASTMLSHAKDSIPDGGISFGRIFHYDYDEKGHQAKNAMLAISNNILDTLGKLKNDPRPHGANGIIMTDTSGNILDELSVLQEDTSHPYATDKQVRDAVIKAEGGVDFCGDLDALVVVSGRRYPKIKNLVGRAFSKQSTFRKVYKDWEK